MSIKERLEADIKEAKAQLAKRATPTINLPKKPIIAIAAGVRRVLRAA